jgi:hypothetical protein
LGQDDVAVWRYWYEDKGTRMGRWVSLADNVDDRLYLGVGPGVTGDGVLVVTNNGDNSDTLWHFQKTRGLVTLKTQIEGKLNGCYLSVNPENGVFYFTAKTHDNGNDVAYWVGN